MEQRSQVWKRIETWNGTEITGVEENRDMEWNGIWTCGMEWRQAWIYILTLLPVPGPVFQQQVELKH